jgi:major vault protein
VIPRNCALKLEALRDFTSGETKHVAGDEWLEFGPKIYTPQIEVKIVDLIKPITIQAN